ncbi:MAG: ATPase, T2SS/T4P/T4SS family [Candidatus Xenobiia bacterium LiM19]
MSKKDARKQRRLELSAGQPQKPEQQKQEEPQHEAAPPEASAPSPQEEPSAAKQNESKQEPPAATHEEPSAAAAPAEAVPAEAAPAEAVSAEAAPEHAENVGKLKNEMNSLKEIVEHLKAELQAVSSKAAEAAGHDSRAIVDEIKSSFGGHEQSLLNLKSQVEKITDHMGELVHSRDGLMDVNKNVMTFFEEELPRLKETVHSNASKFTEFKTELENLAKRVTEAPVKAVDAKAGIAEDVIDKKITEAIKAVEAMAKEMKSKADTGIHNLETEILNISEQLEMMKKAKPASAQGADATELKAHLEEVKAKSESVHDELGSFKSEMASAISQLKDLSRGGTEMKAPSDDQLAHLNATAKLINFIEDKVGAISVTGTAETPLHKLLEAGKQSDLYFTMNNLLEVMINHKAPVLHLRKDAPPLVRVEGELIPVGDKLLTDKDCAYLVHPYLTREHLKALLNREEINFSIYHKKSLFRFNVFIHRSSVGVTVKMHPQEIPIFSDLTLPEELKKSPIPRNGLILIAGPSGSGKSTIAASLIDHINSTLKMHIVTLESPIEFIHKDKLSLITQRELRNDFHFTNMAFLQSLKKDPDLVFVSELNDPEVLMNALVAANSGHLVISTINSFDAVGAIENIVETYTGEARRRIQILLARGLRYILGTRIIDSQGGENKVYALEALVNNKDIAKLITFNNVDAIYTYMEENKTQGTRTLPQAITALYESGVISEDDFHKQKEELQRLFKHYKEVAATTP